MKTVRLLTCIIAFSLAITWIGNFPVYGAEMRVSSQRKSEGIIIVGVKSDSEKKIRIGVHATDSDEEYFFTYNNDGEAGNAIDIPLIFGNGNYSIELYEELKDKYYELCDSYDLVLRLADYESVYLSSSLMVPWSGAEATVAKAGELTRRRNGDFEKFYAIYKFVTENIVYDITKTVESGYRSSPDATLEDGSGICLDIAVLLAAMLRSAGVRCKLVYGSVKDVEGLHSWTEVYFRGKWVIIDPTRDSQYYVSRVPYRYAKSAGDYQSTYKF